MGSPPWLPFALEFFTHKNGGNTMRTKLFKIAQAATLGLAMTFTLSCSSGGDGDPTCGGKLYDTGKYGCVNNELVGTCGDRYYNPENERCLNGEIQNGAEITFPSSGSGGGGNTFTDVRDGKPYKWVKIGSQTWMAENLNYAVEGSKCYGEGGQVVVYMYYDEEGKNSTYTTTTLSNAEIQANCNKYGRLYDWVTAMALPSNCNSSSCASQIRAKHMGICPSGWHIPSYAELGALMQFADPSCSLTGDGCENAGRLLKSTSGWNDYNGNSGNGTDAYGFAALPGGISYSDDGYFSNVGYESRWWSAPEEEDYPSKAWGWRMNRSAYMERDPDGKWALYSVRCVKD
jgi:uncharacterized protein (TIGR02145 family)